MIDAAQHVEAARAGRDETRTRHKQERRALLISEYGAEQARRAHLDMRAPNPHRLVHNARTEAAVLRAESDELGALPVNEAAILIEATRANGSGCDSRWQKEPVGSVTLTNMNSTARTLIAGGRPAGYDVTLSPACRMVAAGSMRENESDM
ncbi:hypothetical protein [Brevibacterium sp. Marseille-P9724]|uniref:hypothetical protein n=1 Tax=Brevibacterium sp. Marseille-P9724 TaxID=2614125 RepID=UPI00125F84FB|nr:hypothetical protein [Brevibacterium sp. Marseille-P9724]